MTASAMVSALVEMHEAVEDGEMAAEAAMDVLWRYSDLGTVIEQVKLGSSDAFLVLLSLLLTSRLLSAMSSSDQTTGREERGLRGAH